MKHNREIKKMKTLYSISKCYIYIVSCACGKFEERHYRKAEAQEAYRKHVDEVMSKPSPFESEIEDSWDWDGWGREWNIRKG